MRQTVFCSLANAMHQSARDKADAVFTGPKVTVSEKAHTFALLFDDSNIYAPTATVEDIGQAHPSLTRNTLISAD